jgi:O-succinylbenzoate synthase
MGDGGAVARAEVLEVCLPLLAPFVTGFGVTASRRSVLVHLIDEAGREGWGEAAALDHPFYLPDTTSAAFSVIAEWALPAALGAGPDPLAVAAALEPIRGNTFARAGVEAAFWSLRAAREEASLAELFGADRRAVPVGESIGLHKALGATLEEVELRLREGYRRIKLKIAPGWDHELVAAVRRAFGDDFMLQVDANGSYRLDDAESLRRLDEYGLTCIEQPLAWDCLSEHAELQEKLATPICLDESLRSPADVRRALDIGACRNVNLKPGRVGGIAASLAIHELCLARQVPLWCGGMLESGIGRAANLALAALPGFTDPADMSPASLLFAWDLVDPTYEVRPDGTIEVPESPGLGFTVSRKRLEEAVLRRELVGLPRD